MRWFLDKFTKENDLVLDPFMGSGTTAVACKQKNRRYIGFEIDPKQIELANKRLSYPTLTSTLTPFFPMETQSLKDGETDDKKQ